MGLNLVHMNYVDFEFLYLLKSPLKATLGYTPPEQEVLNCLLVQNINHELLVLNHSVVASVALSVALNCLLTPNVVVLVMVCANNLV